METRRRRRGGKATLAASSEPSVRPPSPASESESGAESEVESAEAGATGVRSRDPPTTTLPGEAYQTPSAGARAGTEETLAAAPPSPISLAQGGLATPGDELRDTRVERVSPTSPHPLGAEALPPATEGQGPLGVERQDALAWGMVTTVETSSTTQVAVDNPTLDATRNLTLVKWYISICCTITLQNTVNPVNLQILSESNRSNNTYIFPSHHFGGSNGHRLQSTV